jgi:hypothetical protein
MKKKARPAKAHPVPSAREAFVQGQLLGVQPFNAAGDIPGQEAKVGKDGKAHPPKTR